MAPFSPSDYAVHAEPVWPDCWQAWRLFMACSTQWRWASAGLAGMVRTGLDYTALYPLLDREAGTDTALWHDLLADVRECEDAAIEASRITYD